MHAPGGDDGAVAEIVHDQLIRQEGRLWCCDHVALAMVRKVAALFGIETMLEKCTPVILVLFIRRVEAWTMKEMHIVYMLHLMMLLERGSQLNLERCRELGPPSLLAYLPPTTATSSTATTTLQYKQHTTRIQCKAISILLINLSSSSPQSSKWTTPPNPTP